MSRSSWAKDKGGTEQGRAGQQGRGWAEGRKSAGRDFCVRVVRQSEWAVPS